VSGEGLSRSFLEALHGIHEFQLVIGVLFLKRGRVDAPAAFPARLSFHPGTSGTLGILVAGALPAWLPTTISTCATLVE
jgi:hypothetical protein